VCSGFVLHSALLLYYGQESTAGCMLRRPSVSTVSGPLEIHDDPEPILRTNLQKVVHGVGSTIVLT